MSVENTEQTVTRNSKVKNVQFCPRETNLIFSRFASYFAAYALHVKKPADTGQTIIQAFRPDFCEERKLDRLK